MESLNLNHLLPKRRTTLCISLNVLAFTIGSLAMGDRCRAVADPVQTEPVKVVVQDRFKPAGAGEVQLRGRLDDKLQRCVHNRLLDQDVQALVAPYRSKTEVGDGDWRCEYWGKWFTALALADAYQPNSAAASLRDYGTGELLKTVAPDGYLGTRQPPNRMQGWDVWGCKYALLGLLADYDRTGDKKVLQAACRHADVLINELGPGKTNIEDVGMWNGLPASSVLEPIVLLYERTGDERYLAFARHIVSCWDLPSKRLPHGMRLIEDAIDHKRPSQMCAPKAYEMMSCFEGLCELYRATGQKEDLAAAVDLVDSVQSHEATIIGCGTSGEVWCDGTKKQTGVTLKPMETCVTATWMKLNYQLLRLTGESKYADELERNLYNGLLGAMTPRGDWWAYFSGQMGVRVPSYVQHADVGTSCCVLNGPRGLMITPFWAVMQGAAGPVVNLYSPGVISTKTGTQNVRLEITGDYPVDDHVDLAVTLARPEEFAIGFRIPAWSESTSLAVNGEPIAVNAGSYANVRRVWKTGDRVAIHFDMRGRVLDAPDGNGQIAVLRGPVVLSLDNRLVPASDATAVIRSDALPFVDLKPDPAAAAKVNAWMAFEVPFVINGTSQTLTFCDYADAGNEFSETNIFRTWLPQPLDLQTVFKTRQTWKTLSHATKWTDVPPAPLRVDNAENDLALASHGAVATSDSEFSKEPGCTAKANDGILAAADNFTNRWHSSVDSPHPHWVEIKLAHPANIASVIINFADPDGFPVEFKCMALVGGQEREILHVRNNQEHYVYRAQIDPVLTDTFRLVIMSSANPKYPNAAQVSEIQLFAPVGGLSP
jgi:DUF1680 family protein